MQRLTNILPFSTFCLILMAASVTNAFAQENLDQKISEQQKVADEANARTSLKPA